jgi:hypothetical protein
MSANGQINWIVVIIAAALLAGTIWAIGQSKKEAPSVEGPAPAGK